MEVSVWTRYWRHIALHEFTVCVTALHCFWAIVNARHFSLFDHSAQMPYETCQEDLNSFRLGDLADITRTPLYYVDEDSPVRPEIQQPLPEWSIWRGSESSTLETDVCIWCYALLVVMMLNARICIDCVTWTLLHHMACVRVHCMACVTVRVHWWWLRRWSRSAPDHVSTLCQTLMVRTSQRHWRNWTQKQLSSSLHQRSPATLIRPYLLTYGMLIVSCKLTSFFLLRLDIPADHWSKALLLVKWPKYSVANNQANVGI